jgi:DNA-binding XRE family transcriptional regulator
MPSVLLLTDSPQFDARWRAACSVRGLAVESRSASSYVESIAGFDCIVFDGESSTFAGGTLITAVGLSRAQGALVAAALPIETEVDDLLGELCGAAIARREGDVERIASSMQRRTEPAREPRLAHVSKIDSDRLLVIFDDGGALLLDRPLDERDQGEAIREARMAADARSVIVTLADDRVLTLSAEQVLHKHAAVSAPEPSNRTVPRASDEPMGALRDVDGVRLGQRLRALRLAAGLTQAELARRTGIHRPNIARVEAGRHTPSLETLARLAAAIGISTTRVLAD